MPLDELVQVIKTIQQRIRDHGDSLRQNEIRTRVALIDPLLTALGWDVSDPGLVTAEYDVSGKRADYALLGGQGIPLVFLEAKRLDETLSNHRSQVVAYASELGIKYPALTNGRDWEVYDNSKLVPIDQRRVLSVSLTTVPTATSALQMLLLWRPNLGSGQPSDANEPLSYPVDIKPETQQEVIRPQGVPASDENWQSLAGIQNEREVKFPTAVRFPNEPEREVQRWRDVLREVAEWQIRERNLTLEKCPIAGSRRTKRRYVIHSVAEHKDGKSFENPYKLSNGCFLEVHGGDWAVVRSKGLVSELGGNPNSVEIRLS